MPELKHTFMSGRMNKDLDERLVPNGEYRDATNIEVLTSEGSDMGAVQTCFGNRLISDLVPDNESTCVGSVVDDKTNNVYYFIAGKPPTPPSRTARSALHVVSSDLVVEYNSAITGAGTTSPVIVDIYNVRTEITNASFPDLTYTLTSVEGLRIGMEVDVTVTGILAWTQQLPRPIITAIPTLNTVILSSPITNGNPQTGVLRNGNAFNNNSVNVNVNFTAPRVLNFNGNNLITGVNIIDDMLFWTDNYSEPKKVNITRGKEGSIPALGICQACNFNQHSVNGTTHTELVVDGNTIINTSHNGIPLNPTVPGIQEYIQEKHITVIKKSPLTPPKLEMSSKIDRVSTSGVVNSTSASTIQPYHWNGNINNTTGVYKIGTTSQQANDPINNNTLTMINVRDVNDPSIGVDWRVGDVLECTDGQFNTDVAVKLLVTSSDSTTTNPILVQSPSVGNLEVKIIYIDNSYFDNVLNLSNQARTWYVRLKEKEDSLYELKFPKFAYRYKYEDGEYSSFSPFSEIAFLPQHLDWHPKKGYNLGMVNGLKELFIKDFIPTDTPKDVVEVEILYKESDSPNIYTIRSFKDTDPEWNKFGTGEHRGKFKITDDMIHAVVASNQLLRPWDNVPRVALAQELTGNRLIYGNYKQNYNLIADSGRHVKPEFKTFVNTEAFDIAQLPINVGAEKSLKSMRTYQLGISYKDIYGRETPVLSHPSAITKIDSTKADSINSLSIQTVTPPPSWANSFKYYVKEVSNEYYNLAMDRWYNAEDEGIWLSFPSEDRNKVDEETTLILKRGVSNTKTEVSPAVLEDARYKIIAIKNEAPDFIKTLEEIMIDFDAATTISSTGNFDPSGYPTSSQKFIRIKQGEWQKSPLVSLQRGENVQTLYASILGDRNISLQMRIKTTVGDASDWYDVINVSFNKTDEYYQITVTEPFGTDDMGFTKSGTDPIADLTVQIQKKTQENRPEFDGRFFVKVHDDDNIIRTHITDKGRAEDIAVQGQKLLYWMAEGANLAPDNITMVSQDLTIYDQQNGLTFYPYDNSATPAAGTQPDWEEGLLSYNWSSQDPLMAYTTKSWGEWASIYGALGFSNWGGGGSVIPGNPTTSRGGSETEGGWWFIDQEPTYRPVKVENVDSGGTIMNTHDFTALSLAHRYYTQYASWHSGSNPHDSIFYFTSDTGKGAVPGSTTMDLSWVGTRDWPQGSHPVSGTWKDIAGLHPNEAKFIQRISTPGKIFRFIDDPDNIEYEIGESNVSYHLNADVDNYHANTNYHFRWHRYRVRWRLELIEPGSKNINNPNGTPLPIATGGGTSVTQHIYYATNPPNTNTTTSGIKEGPGANKMTSAGVVANTAVRAGIEFVEPVYDQDPEMPEHPAIWETEPKEDVGLDIYHEIGNSYPVNMCDDTEELYIQPGATVSMYSSNSNGTHTISGWSNRNIWTNGVYTPDPFTSANTNTTILSSTHITTVSTSFTHSGYQDPSFNGFGGNPYIILDLPINPNNLVGTTITDPGNFIPAGTTIVAVTLSMPGNQVLELSNFVPTPTPTTVSIGAGTIFTFTGTGAVPILPITTTIQTIVNSIIGCAGDIPVGSTQPSTLLEFNNGQVLNAGDILSFTNPDGTTVTATVAFDSLTNRSATATTPQNQIFLNALTHGETHSLPYYNCYTYGNGLESNRVRDLFNAVTIDKGVKASITLAEQYKEENRKSGLIFSGIYNSMNGVNRLNQFIMAENITKDLNPSYGSIQKLHTRDTDLITLCEDKVLKVLSNKDALYNADDTKNITATSNVLGNSIPFIGEYGISKNPESFASEAFRAYFTDRERGAVMRLSRDGLTPISDHGMKDWFADNLKTVDTLIGSYDSRKALYNITLKDYVLTPTVSFSERSKGWVSFKAFNPEVGFSLNNEYYTAQDGRLWKHHEDSVDRNSFYNNNGTINTSSSITVLFNDLPSVIKSFTTLNYEGSQSKIIENLAGSLYQDSNGDWNVSTDNKYYNNQPELGWYVNSVITDQQTGTVAEFINKEGKWFNYIIGEETVWKNGIVPSDSTAPISGADGNLDTKEFSTQGIGIVMNPPVITTIVPAP